MDGGEGGRQPTKGPRGLGRLKLTLQHLQDRNRGDPPLYHCVNLFYAMQMLKDTHTYTYAYVHTYMCVCVYNCNNSIIYELNCQCQTFDTHIFYTYIVMDIYWEYKALLVNTIKKVWHVQLTYFLHYYCFQHYRIFYVKKCSPLANLLKLLKHHIPLSV